MLCKRYAGEGSDGAKHGIWGCKIVGIWLCQGLCDRVSQMEISYYPFDTTFF